MGGGSQGSETSSSSGEEGASSGSEESSEESVEVTELTSKNIIGEDKEPDWNLIISRVENLYSIWSTISIDLVQLGVTDDKINQFNSNLNEITLKAKETNKAESITKLVDLYGNVLDLYNSFDNNMSNNEKKLKEIKYNIILAYENIESDNWESASDFANKARDINNEILKNIEDTNEYSVKKIHIILNQILDSLNTEDKDIFYINYKNLIEEINLM